MFELQYRSTLGSDQPVAVYVNAQRDEFPYANNNKIFTFSVKKIAEKKKSGGHGMA